MNCIRTRRRTIGIAASVLAIATSAPAVASARPALEPQPAAQASTTNAQGGHDPTGVPPSLSRSQASEMAAIDRAKARAADDQVSPTGPYSTAALTTAATPVGDAHAAGTATGVPPALSRSQTSELAAIDRAKARAADDQPPTGPYSTAALATAATPVASPTLEAPGNGFDWGDAAVGAGVTAAIGILIAAASVAVRHRSEPRHP